MNTDFPMSELARAARRIALAAMVAAAPASAQVAVPDSVTPERVLAGAALFDQGSCARCHGAAGRDGRNGPDLSDDDWLHSDGGFDGVFRTIWWGVERDELEADPPFRFEMHPRGGMPWTRTQTSAVAAYVWSLSRPGTHAFVAEQARLLALAGSGDGTAAVAAYESAAATWPETPLLGEGGLNALAYRALEAGGATAAMPLFELNARLHPDSANVWDSLAEARLAAGDRAGAIDLYRKSLELDPENENAREKLAELEAAGD